MSLIEELRNRNLGKRSRINIDFVVDQMRLKEVLKLPNPAFNGIDETNTAKGPLASTRLNRETIAVANEDGYVNLLRTSKLENIVHWLGHDNAIFDIKAASDGSKLFTASGDSTIKIWDVLQRKEISTFTPHYSTVKSISVYDNNVIASGSRDGSIKVHDLRLRDLTIIEIRDAHRNTILRKTAPKSTKTDPTSCVTNVLFDPTYPRIYSAGANDATIKVWDLRRTKEVTIRTKRSRDGKALTMQPYHEVHHPSKGVHCGYAHLLFSSGKLYAACSDNKIYCYDQIGITQEPTTRFTGYRYDSCLRLSIMDDRFLFSGTKGGGALMWSLARKGSSIYYPETTKNPIGELRPDTTDRYDTNTIEAEWDSLSVISLRDDGLVCKWTMQQVAEQERRKLLQTENLITVSDDISIQMSDIIGVNVLRQNNRVVNQQASQT